MRDLRMQKIFNAAYMLLPAFLTLHEKTLGDRKGVYLAIREIGKNTSDPIEGGIIGFLPSDKIKEKKDFASEKINRMRKNNESCSFESENIEDKQFGGGIKATDYYIAPSGFPPHLDQKFALMVCLMVDEISISQYTDIKEASLAKVNKWRHDFGEPIITRHDF